MQFDVKIKKLSKNERKLALEESKQRFSDMQLKRQGKAEDIAQAEDTKDSRVHGYFFLEITRR